MLSRIVPAVSRLGVSAIRPARTAPLHNAVAWRHFASYGGSRPPPRHQSRQSQPARQNDGNQKADESPEGSSQSPTSPNKVPKEDPAVESKATQEPEPISKQPSESEADSPKELPFHSLPDLTQGIPSTLEYETTGSTRSALTAAPESSGGRTKGELPASAYISSTDRKRKNFARWSFFVVLAGLVGSAVYMGRDWDDDEAKKYTHIPNGWAVGLWWKRAATRSGAMVTYFQEPAFESLLPKLDPLYQKPYTLCISLEDMLVHSEWSREHGWRVAKRPGADYFLRYLSQYYELVLFTTVPSMVAAPIIQKLDPFQMIMFPLFREATKYKDGECVKDLSYLNRDLKKVMILDTNSAHVSAQPENALILPKWTGDLDDKELVSLIPFLEYVAAMEYEDVRKVLKSFEGKHVPTEFARREALARAEFEKQRGIKGKPKRKPGSGLFGVGGLLGLKSSNMSMMVPLDGEQNPSEAIAEGKMLHDIARDRGKRYMEALEKDIRENGEKYLKEQKEAMEKQQKEAMNDMMGGFAGMFLPPGEKDKGKPEEEVKK